jgi:hypothetical protein
MSILDSRTEVDEATERLKTLSDETLSRDLTYWTVASYDAGADYLALQEREAGVRRLHAEAQQWVGLIAAELRARRPSIREVPET